jgi:plastocyanin
VSTALTATALLLAACAATDQPVSQPSPTFSTDVASTPGMQGMGSMPGMSGMPAMTTVTWTNKDEDPHTVVDDGGVFRSRALGSGSTYSFTFPTAGTFDYICSIHPFMHGSVVVTP